MGVLPINSSSGIDSNFEEVTEKFDSLNVDYERDMTSEKEVNANLLSLSAEQNPPVKEGSTAGVSEVLPSTSSHVANSDSKGLTEKLDTMDDDEKSESASKAEKQRRKEEKKRQ